MGKFKPPPLPPGWGIMTPREKAKYGYWLTMEEAKARSQKHERAVTADLGKRDLFFFFMYILGGSKWADNEWAYDRCREIQQFPNGYIDLWSREHLKSTLITFALTLFDLTSNPELTFGLFSHTRPIAKTFLRQMMLEMRQNQALNYYYPEVFWQNPDSEAPKFSEDDGIILKRKGNPKEASIEAWGLVEGQPTGRHFDTRVYDDVVTVKTVNTAEMIQKTTNAFSMSSNLGKEGGRSRIAGTFYSEFDTYNWIIAQGIAKPRIYPATKDGEIDGELVYFSPEYYAEKRRDQTTYDFNCQLLMRPKLEDAAGFQDSWWQTWPNTNHENLNLYIIVDPAGSKSKQADSSSFWLIGYGADANFYAVDLIIDKLSLTEKADILFNWHSQYKIKGTYYEKAALQTDREHYEYRMEKDNFRFKIDDLSPAGRKKTGRINALEPIFKEGRFFAMPQCYHTDHTGKKVDMILKFKNNEYKPWPIVNHDDGLDALAYINDIKFTLPGAVKKRHKRQTRNNLVPFKRVANSDVWAGY